MSHKIEKDVTCKHRTFIEKIEFLGNRFPHPFFLFIILSIAIFIIAAILEGTTFIMPGTSEELLIVSFLNREGFEYVLSNLLTNFVNFPLIPLIVVFTMAIGVGEKSGFYQILITKLFSKIPTSMLYVSFLFLAINGNIISDASLILFPTIGALLFISKGKNPLLAISMSYAGYLAGLSANSLLTGTDVLCAGITESVLGILPITENFNIHTASNWYFMFVSAILLTFATAFTTIKFVEPRVNALGWTPCPEDTMKLQQKPMTQYEKRGLQFVIQRMWVTLWLRA